MKAKCAKAWQATLYKEGLEIDGIPVSKQISDRNLLCLPCAISNSNRAWAVWLAAWLDLRLKGLFYCFFLLGPALGLSGWHGATHSPSKSSSVGPFG